MIRVNVTNNAGVGIVVPFAPLVPGAYDVNASASPGAVAHCSFSPPTSSAEVQEALLAWAATEGVAIGLTFQPVTPVVSAPEAPPAPGPGSPIPDPLNPLGI